LVIASLPAKGHLNFNFGPPVVVGSVIKRSEIGQLIFKPGANESGVAYANFSYQVKDNGGTAGGGVDLDPTSNTITFNVTPVNDAPTGANKTITALEDNAYSFAVSDFGFSDFQDVPANGFAAVKVATLPEKGTLLLNGNAVSAGQFVLVSDLGALTFQPAADGNGPAGQS